MKWAYVSGAVALILAGSIVELATDANVHEDAGRTVNTTPGTVAAIVLLALGVVCALLAFREFRR